MSLVCILGRQAKLCLSELESVYGAENIKPLGETAALVDAVISAEDHLRLGGTIKVAKLLTELPSTNWADLVQYCEKTLPEHLGYLPEGKLKFGLSVYGISVKPQTLQNSGLALKKVIKAAGRSVRVVPNTGPDLNSAQVMHNQLTSALGMELLFIKNGNKTVLAQTTSVQDIDDYAARDFHRPARDAFIGMLPPKLAQIMINLAKPAPGARILDPFCGTGVVLLESVLMRHPVYGTDINQRMVKATRDNLAWIRDRYNMTFDFFVEVADATKHIWQQPVNTVVGETFLGQPLSGLPKPEKLDEIVDGCNTLVTKFLQNLHPQLAANTRICIAVPAWHTKNGFKHLPVVDQLEKIGYNRVSFTHAATTDLLYHRADQIVARELLVLMRK